MKTIKLFFIATFLFTTVTYAQISKENWMVGGTLNLSSAESTSISNGIEYKTKGSGFSVNPNLGYFIADKFCIGTSVGFNFSNPEGDNNNSTGITVSPFARYYFLNTEKTVNVFANVGYGYSSSKTENGYKSHSNGYLFSAGPVIYFNSSVGLEMSLNYSTSKNNSNSKYSQLFLGVGFQIHLKK